MVSINKKNVLSFFIEYFHSIGVGEDAEKFFTPQNFIDCMVLKLPMVCIVPRNKPAASSSNQTHIHITGNGRYFFYSKSEIDDAIVSSDYRIEKLTMSNSNISSLSEKNNGPLINITESFTSTKISKRAKQSAQVQVGRLRSDGEMFNLLRNNLYEGDILAFLKYRAKDEMFVVGIPKSYYNQRYLFDENIFLGLESDEVLSLKTTLENINKSYSDSDVVKRTNTIADTIYQEMVDAAPECDLDYEPKLYITSIPDGRFLKSKRPTTNPSLGKSVIISSGFSCSVDSSHTTFLKKDGIPYMEVHHLIPLEYQEQFLNKLDTAANLISICPTCHKQLHYGRIDDIIPIIGKLYEDRKELLLRSGLNVSIDQLINYYK